MGATHRNAVRWNRRRIRKRRPQPSRSPSLAGLVQEGVRRLAEARGSEEEAEALAVLIYGATISVLSFARARSAVSIVSGITSGSSRRISLAMPRVLGR